MSYNGYMLTREALQFLNIVITYDEYDGQLEREEVKGTAGSRTDT